MLTGHYKNGHIEFDEEQALFILLVMLYSVHHMEVLLTQNTTNVAYAQIAHVIISGLICDFYLLHWLDALWSRTEENREKIAIIIQSHELRGV